MKIEKILIATSVAPFDIENQRNAVNTWFEAGFDVVSLNAPEEISVLECQFSRIKFVSLSRDGREEHGKPFPYIYDMMQYLLQSEYEVTGIINSDIHIANFPQDLYSEIKNCASNGSLIHAHRMETKSLTAEDMNNSYYYYGIDAFFFSRKTLLAFDDDGFCIGNCMWDYWVPMTAAHNSIPQQEIKNLCFWHISHEIKWNQDKMEQYIHRLADKLYDSDYDKACSFFSEHMALYNNALFFPSPKYRDRKVLCVTPDIVTADTLESLKAQTHLSEIVSNSSLANVNTAEYDYIFYAKQGHIYDDCALEIAIQEMEIRNCDKAVLGSSFVVEQSDKPYWWLGSFFIEDMPSLERSKFLYDGKGCKLGFSFSIVSNQYYVTKKLSKIGKVILYPAGGGTEHLINYAREKKLSLNIVALCDGDQAKWGRELCGHTIVQPDSLVQMCFDYVIINSYEYGDEIFAYLSKLISVNKILRVDEFIDYGNTNWIKENESDIREALS